MAASPSTVVNPRNLLVHPSPRGTQKSLKLNNHNNDTLTQNARARNYPTFSILQNSQFSQQTKRVLSKPDPVMQYLDCYPGPIITDCGFQEQLPVSLSYTPHPAQQGYLPSPPFTEPASPGMLSSQFDSAKNHPLTIIPYTVEQMTSGGVLCPVPSNQANIQRRNGRRSRSKYWPPLSDPHLIIPQPYQFETRVIGHNGRRSGRNLMAIFENDVGRRPRTRYNIFIEGGRKPENKAQEQYPDPSTMIPGGQTLNEICKNFPLHPGGTGLRLFIAEGWTAEQIWNELPEDCRRTGAKSRFWNYLQQGFTRQVNQMCQEDGINVEPKRRRRKKANDGEFGEFGCEDVSDYNDSAAGDLINTDDDFVVPVPEKPAAKRRRQYDLTQNDFYVGQPHPTDRYVGGRQGVAFNPDNFQIAQYRPNGVTDPELSRMTRIEDNFYVTQGHPCDDIGSHPTDTLATKLQRLTRTKENFSHFEGHREDNIGSYSQSMPFNEHNFDVTQHAAVGGNTQIQLQRQSGNENAFQSAQGFPANEIDSGFLSTPSIHGHPDISIDPQLQNIAGNQINFQGVQNYSNYAVDTELQGMAFAGNDSHIAQGLPDNLFDLELQGVTYNDNGYHLTQGHSTNGEILSAAYNMIDPHVAQSYADYSLLRSPAFNDNDLPIVNDHLADYLDPEILNNTFSENNFYVDQGDLTDRVDTDLLNRPFAEDSLRITQSHPEGGLDPVLQLVACNNDLVHVTGSHTGEGHSLDSSQQPGAFDENDVFDFQHYSEDNSVSGLGSVARTENESSFAPNNAGNDIDNLIEPAAFADNVSALQGFPSGSFNSGIHCPAFTAQDWYLAIVVCLEQGESWLHHSEGRLMRLDFARAKCCAERGFEVAEVYPVDAVGFTDSLREEVKRLMVNYTLAQRRFVMDSIYYSGIFTQEAQFAEAPTQMQEGLFDDPGGFEY